MSTINTCSLMVMKYGVLSAAAVVAMSTKRGDPRGSRHYKRVRLEVLARDQWTCHYCMQPATTVDHVIPIKAGGDPVAHDNLVACCTRCNSSKGSRNQGVFLGNTPTPSVFSAFLSPMQSKIHRDSPFQSQPNPIDAD